MKVLVTGGAGFIGSHVVVHLLEWGSDVVVLDNLANSSLAMLDRMEALAGKPLCFVKGDVRDISLLRELFAEHAIDAVIHLAGLKSVAESVRLPLDYYSTNVGGILTLLEAMAEVGIHRLVFSSSATVYGDPESAPVAETHPAGRAVNPYGRSKFFAEEVIRDFAATDPRWAVAILRYFNPAGAHASGLIGENPKGQPNNLLPIVGRVAVGLQPAVGIYGNDYPTADGTGVRDYVHVCDLAQGHVQALDFLLRHAGVRVWNMGVGRGYSVLEVLRAFEAVCGKPIPYEVRDRRPGDIAESWADVAKVERDLGWKSRKDIGQIVADVWRWQASGVDA